MIISIREKKIQEVLKLHINYCMWEKRLFLRCLLAASSGQKNNNSLWAVRNVFLTDDSTVRPKLNTADVSHAK